MLKKNIYIFIYHRKASFPLCTDHNHLFNTQETHWVTRDPQEKKKKQLSINREKTVIFFPKSCLKKRKRSTTCARSAMIKAVTLGLWDTSTVTDGQAHRWTGWFQYIPPPKKKIFSLCGRVLGPPRFKTDTLIQRKTKRTHTHTHTHTQTQHHCRTRTEDPAKSRLARSRPAWMATGVSWGRPSTISPIA